MLTGKAIGIALLAITAVALGLRVTGLDRLQPSLQEPDPYLVDQVRIFRAGEQGREGLPIPYYAYPTIFARCVALMAEPAVDPVTPPERLLAAHKRAAVGDLMRLRTTVAWISILLVPLTWLLARRLVGPGPALLAAALMAVSMLHLLFSQQARPHAVHATVALAAVVLATRLRRTPTWGMYAACAIAFALAVGVLHSGVAVVFPIAAAHLLRERTPGRAPWWAAPLALVPAALVVVSFYPGSPEVIGEGTELKIGGHTLPFDRLDGSGFARMAEFLWSYEPALAVLAGIALAALGARALRGGVSLGDRRGDLLVALAYALPYVLALGVLGLTEDRFLIPLLPFLATLVASLLALARGRPAAQVGLAALVLAFPSWVVARYVAVRSAPDTYEQAAAWVEDNLDPASDRVALTPVLALPLFHSAEALRIGAGNRPTRQQAWTRWQIANVPSEEAASFAAGPRWNLFLSPGVGKLLETGQDAWLEQVNANYAILEVSRKMSNLAPVMVLRDRVQARGTPLHQIRGEDVSRCSGQPIDYQDVPGYAARILRAKAFGPCIEIYRLGPP